MPPSSHYSAPASADNGGKIKAWQPRLLRGVNLSQLFVGQCNFRLLHGGSRRNPRRGISVNRSGGDSPPGERGRDRTLLRGNCVFSMKMRWVLSLFTWFVKEEKKNGSVGQELVPAACFAVLHLGWKAHGAWD